MTAATAAPIAAASRTHGFASEDRFRAVRAFWTEATAPVMTVQALVAINTDDAIAPTAAVAAVSPSVRFGCSSASLMTALSARDATFAKSINAGVTARAIVRPRP